MILDNKQDVGKQCMFRLPPPAIIGTEWLTFLPKSYVPFKVPTQFWTEFFMFVDVD